ncbi:DUF2637 domain-containing protein [Micromonospora globbae]|uniref:DUF2637 domain-containing protein n=1 Tax=Micromonospora globbae TaxID=1894969 RepID=UPI0037B49CE9
MTSTPQPATVPVATPTAESTMTGKQLRRLRWAVRATLTLGVAASVAANVLHARPNPISQIIAAWPPLALLLTVELISRVPHHRWYLGAIRVTAAAVIAVIAAWVSYWHLVGVAARYGESGYGAAYLLPISVDGLVVVASVSLVEITARIRATSAHTTTDQAPALTPTAPDPLSAAVRHIPSPPETNEVTVPASPADQHPLGAAAHIGALTTSTRPSILTPHAATPPTPGTSEGGAGGDGGDGPAPPPRRGTKQRSPGPVTAAGAGNTTIDLPVGALNETAAPATKTTDPIPSDVMPQVIAPTDAGLSPTPELTTGTGPAADASGYEREDPPDGAAITADTAAAVAYWRRRDPAAKPAEVAARIGRSERTVRRHWDQRAKTDAGRRNGHPAGTPRH